MERDRYIERDRGMTLKSATSNKRDPAIIAQASPAMSDERNAT